MSQVQNLLFELHNERTLKEQFLNERNALKAKVEEMQKALEKAKAYLESSASWNHKKYSVYHNIEQALKGESI